MGELVEETDSKTFSLLTKVFGPGGPYRKVLKRFGIGNDKSHLDYLIYLDGKVYSDIEKESEVLWKHCMCELSTGSGEVTVTAANDVKSIILGIYGFLKKNLMDTFLISFPDRTLHSVSKRYQEYCEIFENALNDKSISLSKFLSAYENVVYVTYIYELFYSYNLSLNLLSVNKSCISDYTNKNDYLVRFDNSYFEIASRDGKGFNVIVSPKFSNSLDNLSRYKLIPKKLPKLVCNVDPSIQIESELQCLKNNMRLKSDALIKLIDEYREI